MFFAHPQTYSPNLIITNAIDPMYISAYNAHFYDKDGFELTPLEIEYYKQNNVPLTSCLYNLACHKPWIEQRDFSSGIYLDHSMIVERYSFGGEALEQLKTYSHAVPQLWKLIQTKHKWGFDFSVDYIKDGEATDVFHLEMDSYDYEHILIMHEKVTKTILGLDWEDGAKTIRKHKDEWQHLEGHAQSNWKAQFFGFPAAEEICKAF